MYVCKCRRRIRSQLKLCGWNWTPITLEKWRDQDMWEPSLFKLQDIFIGNIKADWSSGKMMFGFRWKQDQVGPQQQRIVIITYVAELGRRLVSGWSLKRQPPPSRGSIQQLKPSKQQLKQKEQTKQHVRVGSPWHHLFHQDDKQGEDS